LDKRDLVIIGIFAVFSIFFLKFDLNIRILLFYKQETLTRVKISPTTTIPWRIRFLRQMKISKIFLRLTDKRQKGKICYSSFSLIHWALSACSFRLGPNNALETSLDNLSSGHARLSRD
jgi:hypothetical protein